ncbi:MAG: hypothetical protein MUE85_09575 [Microscillaceae bacterium]|jgi:hypothetical protein|nr:hypothetical protein [Microscillaceae bacterium]
MKKIILCSIFSLGLNVALFAQDIIVETNGNEIMAKVIKVTQTEVEFKTWNTGDEKIHTITRNGIQKIKYQDGYVLNNDPKSTVTITPPSTTTTTGIEVGDPNIKPANRFGNNELYQKGFADAGNYYSGYQGAGTATIVLTVLSGGIVGLIPAVACSTTPPKLKNLGIPPSNYSQSEQYIAGYTAAAKKIKSRKVWQNYGTGIGILLGLGILLSVAGGGQ